MALPVSRRSDPDTLEVPHMVMSWIDLLTGLTLLWLAVAGFRNGLTAGVVSLAASGTALWAAAQLTPTAADLARQRLDVPALLAEPAAFGVLIIVGLTLASTLATAIVAALRGLFSRVPFLAALDHLLGPLPAVSVGATMLAVVSLGVAASPFDFGVKDELHASFWGRRVLPYFSALAPEVDEVVRKLPAPSVPTYAPGEQVGETSRLPVPDGLALRVDEREEQRMLELVNAERVNAGLRPLALDPAITAVARAHSRAMFARQFFAHTDPDGRSPFDRMAGAGIRFHTAGENLAYAPAVEQAHTGLMNSPGHRANILRPEFRRIGIGVIASDGYGRTYTQNFAD